MAFKPIMSKIPPIRIYTEDCMVVIGRTVDADGEIVDQGLEIPVHEDEWVELVPVSTVAMATQWSDSTVDIPDPPDDDDESPEAEKLHRYRLDLMQQHIAESEERFQLLLTSLSHRIVDWSWRDIVTGDPLPNPHQRPEVLWQLSAQEIGYLRVCLNREGSVQLKNVEGGSPNGSSEPPAKKGQPPERSSSVVSATPSAASRPRR